MVTHFIYLKIVALLEEEFPNLKTLQGGWMFFKASGKNLSKSLINLAVKVLKFNTSYVTGDIRFWMTIYSTIKLVIIMTAYQKITLNYIDCKTSRFYRIDFFSI